MLGVSFDELPLSSSFVQDAVEAFEMIIAVTIARGLSCSSRRILLNR